MRWQERVFVDEVNALHNALSGMNRLNDEELPLDLKRDVATVAREGRRLKVWAMIDCASVHGDLFDEIIDVIRSCARLARELTEACLHWRKHQEESVAVARLHARLLYNPDELASLDHFVGRCLVGAVMWLFRGLPTEYGASIGHNFNIGPVVGLSVLLGGGVYLLGIGFQFYNLRRRRIRQVQNLTLDRLVDAINKVTAGRVNLEDVVQLETVRADDCYGANSCCVCWEENQKFLCFPCYHVICRTCLKDLLFFDHKSCPTCRTEWRKVKTVV
jgi:hypothetical protein